MIEATRRTLEAAKFFHRRLLEAQTNKWNSEPGAFLYFFGAFIQAARNVTWAMGHEEPAKYKAWKPVWEKQLRLPEEKALEDTTNELRLDEVKRGGAQVRMDWEEMTVAEMIALDHESSYGSYGYGYYWHPAYGVHSSSMPGVPQPAQKRLRASPIVVTKDGEAKMIELGKTYIEYLEKKVAAFEAALA